MLTTEILQMIIPELIILPIGNAGVKTNEKVIRILTFLTPIFYSISIIAIFCTRLDISDIKLDI